MAVSSMAMRSGRGMGAWRRREARVGLEWAVGGFVDGDEEAVRDGAAELVDEGGEVLLVEEGGGLRVAKDGSSSVGWRRTLSGMTMAPASGMA
jgi:hypothetical protein